MTQNVQPAGSVLTNYGIVAWIVYGVLSGGGHWIGAALGAVVVALAILVNEYRCHAVKILNCTAAAFFAFSLMTTIAVGPALFKHYNTFLTWSVFAIVTWVTFLIGFPFTLQYAREQAVWTGDIGDGCARTWVTHFKNGKHGVAHRVRRLWDRAKHPACDSWTTAGVDNF